MATEPLSPDEFERLNALVDGELPPAEHAALAGRIAAQRDLARAHATLARLKACVAEGRDSGSPFELPMPRRSRTVRLGAVSAVAAIGVLGFVAAVGLLAVDRLPPGIIAPEIAATLAALPATPVIPDLTVTGLQLSGTTIEHAEDATLLLATYRGPRGCRLELRVRPLHADSPPARGTARAVWTVDELAYELTAFGMPASRFAVVAQVAKAATRLGRPPEPVDRLREARAAAPPCVG
jgi:hypothetical protein